MWVQLRELEAAGRAELDRQHAHPAPVWADVRQQQQQQQRQQPANNILPAGQCPFSHVSPAMGGIKHGNVQRTCHPLMSRSTDTLP